MSTTRVYFCSFGYKFTGKERDAESGNDYFGARYYSSSMGRFMSPDWSVKEEPVPYAKLDNPQTLNLYSYVQNNPLSSFDDDGHVTIEVKYTPTQPGGNHSFIVVTDRDGTQTVFRAGPSGDGPSRAPAPSALGGASSQSSDSQSNSSNSSSPGAGPGGPGQNTGPWGNLQATQESPTAPGGDNMSPISATVNVLSNDQPASGYVTALSGYNNAVNQANITYNPLTTNSNAYTSGALQTIGVMPPKPPVLAPGSGTSLPVIAPGVKQPPPPPPCSVAGACSK